MTEKTHNSKRRSITSRQRNKRKESPRVEVSAGGVVFKRTGRGIFFAMLKDSYGKWTFPKGHVKRGESYVNAAKREIDEEMGIENLHLVRSLGHIDIWFRDRFVYKGKLIHKYIHYFLFELRENVRLEKPEPTDEGERIQAVAWVPMDQVLKRSNYKDMKPILKRVFKVLEETGKAKVKKKPFVRRPKKRYHKKV